MGGALCILQCPLTTIPAICHRHEAISWRHLLAPHGRTLHHYLGSLDKLYCRHLVNCTVFVKRKGPLVSLLHIVQACLKEVLGSIGKWFKCLLQLLLVQLRMAKVSTAEANTFVEAVPTWLTLFYLFLHFLSPSYCNRCLIDFAFLRVLSASSVTAYETNNGTECTNRLNGTLSFVIQDLLYFSAQELFYCCCYNNGHYS